MKAKCCSCATSEDQTELQVCLRCKMFYFCSKSCLSASKKNSNHLHNSICTRICKTRDLLDRFGSNNRVRNIITEVKMIWFILTSVIPYSPDAALNAYAYGMELFDYHHNESNSNNNDNNNEHHHHRSMLIISYLLPGIMLKLNLDLECYHFLIQVDKLLNTFNDNQFILSKKNGYQIK